MISRLFLIGFAHGVLKGRHGAQPSESLLDMPRERFGQLRRVGFGGDWGSNPYPLTAGDPSEAGDISEGATELIFTDMSENGNRIRKELLDMHNYVRKLEAPAAKYMTKLTWDFHLEAYSRVWARALCDNPSEQFFDHSPDNQSGIPKWPYRISTGENLYTSSAARPSSDDFSDVVKKWYDERNDFNWSTGQSNDPSKPVGHWKQLVRPQATTVGCTVIGNCHSSGWRTYVVCHYDYGNIGTLPYEPGTGDSGLCQNCPAGFDSCCESGLCTGRSDLNSNSLAPYKPAVQKTEEWYGCATFKRSDCQGTGALKFIENLPGSDLEFQQCSCGNDFSDFQDVVNNKYFWFRNRCYQANESGDDNSDVNNIYAMISLKSIHQKLFKDKGHVESAVPNPALQIEAKGGKKSGGLKVKKASAASTSSSAAHALKDLNLSVDKESDVNMDVKASKGVMMKLNQQAEDTPDSLKLSLHESPKEELKALAIPPSLKANADLIGDLVSAQPPANVMRVDDKRPAPSRRLQVASSPPPPSKNAMAKPPTKLNETLAQEPAKLIMGSP